MKKVIGFLICIILSLGILALSLITETISCDQNSNLCVFQSKIRYLNIELNKEIFPVQNLNSTRCIREYQPSRRGKKSYYILKTDLNDRTYNIMSYSKLKTCRQDVSYIKTSLKSGNGLYLNTPPGFLNILGIIFSIVTAIIGIIIIKETPPQEDEFKED